ncbi:MAG: penicillin-binding transpeptidase domain-containing protein [Pseudomonadota bacterium]
MSATVRLISVIIILLIMTLAIFWRIFDLMVVKRNFLLRQGDSRSIRLVKIPAYRGMILDRNGQPLAISVPVASVWVNPKQVVVKADLLKPLAKLLGWSEKQLQNYINKNKHYSFLYIKRDIPPQLAEKIKQLKLKGVYLQQAFKRYYPEGEVAAQLVGLTNIDDQGQEGEELVFNRWLSGQAGKKRVLVDSYGHVVANLDLIKPAIPGNNLVLSIDSRIQYEAYRDLKAAVLKYHAKSGSIVVMDVNTGEVLAMVDVPSYNPNDRPKIHDGRFRNRAVTDVFEPGSTIKAFSVANALESGKYTPDTPINTSPGWLKVGHDLVKDDADYGLLDVTGVLQKSSNVGVTKMTLSLPANSLWQILHNFGFGQRTHSGFPGESPGFLPQHKLWDPFVLATLSFGYGLAVTNLQLAHAYATLAAGGVKHPVTLLRLQGRVKSERIIRQNIAQTIIAMLETVVEKGGTATRAQVPGYRDSGKTGTVRMVGPHGYEANHHTGIFVGIAPVGSPRLVVSVVIKDPQGTQFYGGLVAAPVFAKVMSAALRILNISPDPVKSSNSKVFSRAKSQ